MGESGEDESVRGVIARIRCALLHDFGGWTAVQELPLWKHNTSLHRAIGNQPVERRTYAGTDGKLYEKYVSDLDYRLVGKVYEQRRVCWTCYLTQIRKRTWTV